LLRKLKIGLIASVAMVATLMGVTPAGAATAAPLSPELQNTFVSYGLHNNSLAGIVVDSAMTDEQAIDGGPNDAAVPPALRAMHDQMKPLLRVIPVIHWGYDGRVHLGQLVVNKGLVTDAERLYIHMFLLHFPIYSVIPETAFGYVDDASMAANNSSCYRPDMLGTSPSEHFKGAAFDVNTYTNPEHMLLSNGTTFIDPPGAVYDPTAKGAITKEGPVRKYWTSLGYEWGGGWGDPNADPPTDFFRVGFFDYQHFQLNYLRIDTEPLPAGWVSTTSSSTAKTHVVKFPTRSEYALAG